MPSMDAPPSGSAPVVEPDERPSPRGPAVETRPRRGPPADVPGRRRDAPSTGPPTPRTPRGLRSATPPGSSSWWGRCWSWWPPWSCASGPGRTCGWTRRSPSTSPGCPLHEIPSYPATGRRPAAVLRPAPLLDGMVRHLRRGGPVAVRGVRCGHRAAGLAGRATDRRAEGRLGGHAARGHVAVRHPLRHRDPDVLPGGTAHRARVPGPRPVAPKSPSGESGRRGRGDRPAALHPLLVPLPDRHHHAVAGLAGVARTSAVAPGRPGLVRGRRRGRMPHLPAVAAHLPVPVEAHRDPLGHAGQLRRHGQCGRPRSPAGAPTRVGPWPSCSSPWPGWVCSAWPPTGATSNSTSAPDRWAAHWPSSWSGTLGAAIAGGFLTNSAFDARYASVVFIPLILMVAVGLTTFRDRRIRSLRPDAGRRRRTGQLGHQHHHQPDPGRTGGRGHRPLPAIPVTSWPTARTSSDRRSTGSSRRPLPSRPPSPAAPGRRS